MVSLFGWLPCGCCGGGLFDFYYDGPDDEVSTSDGFSADDTTYATTVFSMFGSVVDADHATLGPPWNTAYDTESPNWWIEASEDKLVQATLVGGFQSTTEQVQSIEIRSSYTTSAYGLVMYDGIGKTELADIELSLSSNNDYPAEAPTTDIQTNVSSSYTFAGGVGIGYNAFTRGTISFDGSTHTGEWVEHTYTPGMPGSYARDSDTFDIPDWPHPYDASDTWGTLIETEFFEETGPGDEDIYYDKIEFLYPTHYAPRYWPYVSGERRHVFGAALGSVHEPGSFTYIEEAVFGDVTVEEYAEVFYGTVDGVSASALDWPSDKVQIAELYGPSYTGNWQDKSFQSARGSIDLKIYAIDISPGGYVAIIWRRYIDDATYDPENDVVDYIYDTQLIINGSVIDTVEIASPSGFDVGDCAAIWGNAEVVHAVHPKNNIYSYLVKKYDGIDTWTLKCYSNASTPTVIWSQDTEGSEPAIGWSSDRWITVGIELTSGQSTTVTGGDWTEAHEYWNVSHDGTRWVMCGVLDGMGDIDDQHYGVAFGLTIDCVKNSRLMDQQIVPPDRIYGRP